MPQALDIFVWPDHWLQLSIKVQRHTSRERKEEWVRTVGMEESVMPRFTLHGKVPASIGGKA